MANIAKSFVGQTSTTTGTGDLVMSGSLDLHSALSAVMSVGDTGEFVARDDSNGAWVRFIGTYSAANTLTRTTFLESSTGSNINFAAGTRIVYLVGPILSAQKFIMQGTADVAYPNAQFTGALATGLVKNTTTTGVLSIATANTDYMHPTGADGAFTRWMLQDTGYVYYNSNTTNALDYVNGSHQRWAPSGTVTLSMTNWPPSGNLGELLIEGVNLGAATITWPSWNWVKPDGTTTTSISTYLTAISATLQSSGTDWVLAWTRDAGTTIYAKLVR